ncbi:glutamine synthetase family protein, partial [Mycolicibacterium porcinum]
MSATARTAEDAAVHGIGDGSITEIEVAWSDPFGHAQGKRIPAAGFLDRARGSGFAFCEASLGWNTDATVIDGLRLTNWDGGYPDVYAVPDLSTFRPLPWRPGTGHVISDIVTHDRSPSQLDPRAVLRRVLAQVAELGYTAKVGVELEFYLLDPDGSAFQPDIHAYSLENANALDPLLTDLQQTLAGFTRLEGIETEYGPGQVEANLVYTDALDAADDAARLKYAAKEVARRYGKIASFMPKPFTEHSGSSAHLHISLWKDGEPAFAPQGGTENPLALWSIAGLLEHLPSITLFGAHSVNAYRRFVPDSFAPATVTWSRDNRSAAVRSLVEADPSATRIELRSGASDSNPYWLVASALAAVVAGIR